LNHYTIFGMIYLKENIRFFRKKLGLTQEDLANRLETKRSLIGSYEEGRGVPKLDMLKRMSDLFGVTLDEFLSVNFCETGNYMPEGKVGPKILSVMVTPDNEEHIVIVPLKASAGYLNGRSDPEYFAGLPHFSMPVPELSHGRSYRVFQIKGDSMLPVPPGSYIFCDYVENVEAIQEGKTYILITADEGIVYKRVYHGNKGELLLKSDNQEYSPYTIETTALLEIWRAMGYLSFDLPDQDAVQVQKLSSVIFKLEEELKMLKSLKK